MKELTLAERYQKALIEAEQFNQECLELSFANEGNKSKEAKKDFIEALTKSFADEEKYAVVSAEDLLKKGVAVARFSVVERIARNEKALKMVGTPARKRIIQQRIDKDLEYKNMSDDELKEVLVAEAEKYKEKMLTDVKAETLIAELGLTGKKNYAAGYNFVGLYSADVMAKIEREQIGALAEMIKQSDDFRTLQKYSKVAPVLDLFIYNSILGKTKLGEMAEAKAESMDKMIDLSSYIDQLNIGVRSVVI